MNDGISPRMRSWVEWCKKTREHNQKLLREHGGTLPGYRVIPTGIPPARLLVERR